MNIQSYKNNKYTFYNTKRLNVIKKNFKKNLGLDLKDKKFPVISVCASGGGFRSMLATLGALEGLENLNLLNSIYFFSTLSGSSWGALSWILSDKEISKFNTKISFNLNKIYLLKDIYKIDFNSLNKYKKFLGDFYNLVFDLRKFKLKNNHKFGFVDLYGVFLALIILDNLDLNILDIELSDLITKIDKGIYPDPIFSATAQLNNNEYEWFEFTPKYIGSNYINYFLHSYDSKIKIISLLGLLGSSFSGSFQDILTRILQLPLPKEFVEIIVKTKNKIGSFSWSSKRVGAAYLDNFTYGLKDSPIKSLKKFPVFDGGYISNLPLEPLLNRQIRSDIIFVLDNTGILPQTSVLKDAEAQLLKKGYRLPKIDYEKAKNKNISIFKRKDKNMPTIVYIPLKKDLTYSTSFDPKLEKFCKTTNFFYSKEQAERLIGLSRHIIINNKDQILNLLIE